MAKTDNPADGSTLAAKLLLTLAIILILICLGIIKACFYP